MNAVSGLHSRPRANVLQKCRVSMEMSRKSSASLKVSKMIHVFYIDIGEISSVMSIDLMMKT